MNTFFAKLSESLLVPELVLVCVLPRLPVKDQCNSHAIGTANIDYLHYQLVCLK